MPEIQPTHVLSASEQDHEHARIVQANRMSIDLDQEIALVHKVP